MTITRIGFRRNVIDQLMAPYTEIHVFSSRPEYMVHAKMKLFVKYKLQSISQCTHTHMSRRYSFGYGNRGHLKLQFTDVL